MKYWPPRAADLPQRRGMRACNLPLQHKSVHPGISYQCNKGAHGLGCFKRGCPCECHAEERAAMERAGEPRAAAAAESPRRTPSGGDAGAGERPPRESTLRSSSQASQTEQ